MTKHRTAEEDKMRLAKRLKEARSRVLGGDHKLFDMRRRGQRFLIDMIAVPPRIER